MTVKFVKFCRLNVIEHGGIKTLEFKANDVCADLLPKLEKEMIDAEYAEAVGVAEIVSGQEQESSQVLSVETKDMVTKPVRKTGKKDANE